MEKSGYLIYCSNFYSSIVLTWSDQRRVRDSRVRWRVGVAVRAGLWVRFDRNCIDHIIHIIKSRFVNIILFLIGLLLDLLQTLLLQKLLLSLSSFQGSSSFASTCGWSLRSWVLGGPAERDLFLLLTVWLHSGHKHLVYYLPKLLGIFHAR